MVEALRVTVLGLFPLMRVRLLTSNTKSQGVRPVITPSQPLRLGTVVADGCFSLTATLLGTSFVCCRRQVSLPTAAGSVHSTDASTAKQPPLIRFALAVLAYLGPSITANFVGQLTKDTTVYAREKVWASPLEERMAAAEVRAAWQRTFRPLTAAQEDTLRGHSKPSQCRPHARQHGEVKDARPCLIAPHVAPRKDFANAYMTGGMQSTEVKLRVSVSSGPWKQGATQHMKKAAAMVDGLGVSLALDGEGEWGNDKERRRWADGLGVAICSAGFANHVAFADEDDRRSRGSVVGTVATQARRQCFGQDLQNDDADCHKLSSTPRTKVASTREWGLADEPTEDAVKVTCGKGQGKVRKLKSERGKDSLVEEEDDLVCDVLTNDAKDMLTTVKEKYMMDEAACDADCLEEMEMMMVMNAQSGKKKKFTELEVDDSAECFDDAATTEAASWQSVSCPWSPSKEADTKSWMDREDVSKKIHASDGGHLSSPVTSIETSEMSADSTDPPILMGHAYVRMSGSGYGSMDGPSTSYSKKMSQCKTHSASSNGSSTRATERNLGNSRSAKHANGDGAVLLGEALCRSQTRAREAEFVAEAVLIENQRLRKFVFREASRSYTHRLWVNILEVENDSLKMRGCCGGEAAAGNCGAAGLPIAGYTGKHASKSDGLDDGGGGRKNKMNNLRKQQRHRQAADGSSPCKLDALATESIPGGKKEPKGRWGGNGGVSERENVLSEGSGGWTADVLTVSLAIATIGICTYFLGLTLGFF